MRLYAAQRKPALVEASYQRCRSALEQLGCASRRPPKRSMGPPPPLPSPGPFLRFRVVAAPVHYREERKLVSVIFVELSGPAGFQKADPEDLRELVGGAVAALISEVEALGGTVTSVFGAGLAALFGAPESHEDDPERAVRAGHRMLSALVGPLTASWGRDRPSRGGCHRQGNLGRLRRGGRSSRRGSCPAIGRPTGLGARRPGHPRGHSRPVQWGPTEAVATSPEAKPLVACYLERPKARPSGQAGRRQLANRPL